MKTFKLLLLVAAFGAAIYYTEARAQTQFDYFGGIGISANSTGCLYIDVDTYISPLGINDVVLVHGNGEIYFDDVIGDSMRAPARSMKYTNNKKLWADCNVSTNNFSEERVYILRDLQNVTPGSHVLPFKYKDFYNYLVLRVTTDSVIVRGWVFHIVPEDWECYDLEAQRSIEQPIKKDEEFTFKDYDNMGFEVDEYYRGLIIRRYSNGKSEHIYR